MYRLPVDPSLPRRAAIFVGAALTLLGAQKVSAQEGRPDRYAIVDARIVAVSRPVIERGTIVLEGGVITAVGSGVTPPPGAWVIDGSNLTVYPGLIDAMSTLGMPQGAATAAPFSRGPEDRPATFTWVEAADHLEPSEDAFGPWR